MKKNVSLQLFLTIMFLQGCGAIDIKRPHLTEAESKRAGEAFYNRSQEVAASSLENYEIILGYSFGMDGGQFDAHTRALLTDKQMEITGTTGARNWYSIKELPEDLEFQVSFILMPVYSSSFRSSHSRYRPDCDNIEHVEIERDRLIRWAIAKYGDDYVVTLTQYQL